LQAGYGGQGKWRGAGKFSGEKTGGVTGVAGGAGGSGFEPEQAEPKSAFLFAIHREMPHVIVLCATLCATTFFGPIFEAVSDGVFRASQARDFWTGSAGAGLTSSTVAVVPSNGAKHSWHVKRLVSSGGGNSFFAWHSGQWKVSVHR
jgi:hypothetical protein